MAYKLYINANILYLIDTIDENRQYEGAAKDCLHRRKGLSSTKFAFKGLNQWADNKLIDFADIQDKDGNPISNTFATPQLLSDYLDEELGKSSPQDGGQSTGWGVYTDLNYTEAAPLSIVGGAAYVNLTNNKASFIETQKPLDVATFYDGTVITGRNGDGINITLSFSVKPKTNQVTSVNIVPDIGGAVGEIQDYAKDQSFGKGLNVVQRYLSSFNAFTLGTWEANGAQLKIKATDNCDIFNIRYLITRTHKAR